MAAGLQARGLDPASAKEAALRMMNGLVSRQGLVLGFEKTFFVQAAAFLAVLPLLYFLRVGKRTKAAAPHVELSVE
jgi:hypothetical protein